MSRLNYPSDWTNTTRARVKRPRAGAATAPAPEQDSEFATKMSCAEHGIEYYSAPRPRARCPMCRIQAHYDEVRAELLMRTNELERVNAKMERLQVQVDLQAAIRAAIEVLDDNDYAWLKLQMYQYKIDKSVSLKPTHGKLTGGKRMKRGERLPPNGFMTLPKKGDPEAHAATSFGGLAMAEYLDEAIACMGSAQAMGVMLKAWWKALPGGQE